MNTYLSSEAELSPCGSFRYYLRRAWGQQGRELLWIMLNPSTADAMKDDATIRKCVGFAQRWGYDSTVVANLYALRSTNPKALESAPDPIGPDNNRWIKQLVLESTGICAGWGASGPSTLDARSAEVMAMIPGEIFCIGTTKTGRPRHPSRPGYATPV